MDDFSLNCRLAFSFLKQVDAEFVRNLIDHEITPEDFFRMERYDLYRRLGIKDCSAFEPSERELALSLAAREMEQITRHNIKVHSLFDENYPIRLSQIPDAPLILYQLGDTDLNSQHIINIVGTRRHTPYGLDFCNGLVKDLAAYFPDLVVVSGLAFGIDAAAHNAALSSSLPTVGVVAHGLNMIYPAAHRNLARQLLKSGGSIVSEYPFGEQPYRQRFLERNRVIAGLSDVTIVVESDIKGGAMSTANTAFSYSRDVMALPGRISDRYSSGCNLLLRKQKAHLITCAADLIELTGWKPHNLNINTRSRNLFPELSGDAKTIYEAIRFAREPMLIDTILLHTQIPISRLMTVLSEMEFDGILFRYPGNRYTVS